MTRRAVASWGLVIGGLGFVAAGLGVTVAAASTSNDSPPPSNKTLVGVMVDSKDGLTESVINCGKDGKHQTVDGDGTLFMPNLSPHRVTCTITIRYADDVN